MHAPLGSGQIILIDSTMITDLGQLPDSIVFCSLYKAENLNHDKPDDKIVIEPFWFQNSAICEDGR